MTLAPNLPTSKESHDISTDAATVMTTPPTTETTEFGLSDNPVGNLDSQPDPYTCERSSPKALPPRAPSQNPHDRLTRPKQAPTTPCTFKTLPALSMPSQTPKSPALPRTSRLALHAAPRSSRLRQPLSIRAARAIRELLSALSTPCYFPDCLERRCKQFIQCADE
jgi:hypothetical protein